MLFVKSNKRSEHEIPQALKSYAAQLGYPKSERLGAILASLIDNEGKLKIAERCEFEAIEVDDMAKINLGKCFGCGVCVPTCPSDELTLEEVEPEDHIRVT